MWTGLQCSRWLRDDPASSWRFENMAIQCLVPMRHLVPSHNECLVYVPQPNDLHPLSIFSRHYHIRPIRISLIVSGRRSLWNFACYADQMQHQEVMMGTSLMHYSQSYERWWSFWHQTCQFLCCMWESKCFHRNCRKPKLSRTLAVQRQLYWLMNRDCYIHNISSIHSWSPSTRLPSGHKSRMLKCCQISDVPMTTAKPVQRDPLSQLSDVVHRSWYRISMDLLKFLKLDA